MIALNGFQGANSAWAQDAPASETPRNIEDILQEFEEKISNSDELEDLTDTENTESEPLDLMVAEDEELTKTPKKKILSGEEDFDEESGLEDVVLAVFVGRDRVSSGVFAIQQNNNFYLPVVALADMFGFLYEANLNEGIVRGFAINEDNTYLVDLKNRKIAIEGRSTDISEMAFIDPSTTSDDVYVEAALLQEIWPLYFNVDLGALILRVEANEKLPFQRILERQRRQKSATSRRSERIEFAKNFKNLPFIPQPYKFFSLPTVDIDTRMGFDARVDGLEYNTSLTGVQDLLFASADYSLNYSSLAGQSRRPESLRLRFTRQDIHPGALPAGLENVQWGDVRLQNREVISAGSGGRGLVFSTQNTNLENEFDTITVEGIARPGWETELYINEELIAFGTVDERGEYRFEDVDIGFGNNEVKVVLYGPQGQTDTRIENYFFRSNIARSGETIFNGGIVEAEKDLIPIEPRNTFRPEGWAGNFYGAHGITSRLTAFASANTLVDRDDGAGSPEKRRNYVTSGVVGSFGKTLGQFEVYKQLSGGEAYDLRTVSDFMGFKFNARGTLYSDFESPSANNGQAAKEREYDLNVRRIIGTGLGSLGLEVGTDYLKRKNGTETRNLTTRQSIGRGGLRLTNQTRTNIVNSSHGATTGRLSSVVTYDDWRFRNAFTYNIFPELEGSSFQTEARYGSRKKESAALTLTKNFDSQEAIVGFQLTKDFEKFLGSVETDWSSLYGASILFRASTSLGPYDRDGGYIMNSEPMRTAGPVSAFVFKDADYDGVFSEGDTPIEGSKVQIGRRVTREETDEDGYLFTLRGNTGARVGIAVSKGSIDDPYFVSAQEGYSIYPRPGVVQRVNLPLIDTGAIDGTVYDDLGNGLAGLGLELLNDQTDVIAKTVTGPDGYYTFERVPPGSYTIRANPESGVTVPFKYVELTPDNLFQFGMDIAMAEMPAREDSDLDIGIGKDGAMELKNIMSIAKGFKEKMGRTGAATQPPVKTASIQNDPQVIQTMMENGTVTALRLGVHKDKTRLVMDLSQSVPYEILQEEGTIVVQMPPLSWQAKKSGDGDKTRLIRYNQEDREQNTALVLTLGNGAKLLGHGLLPPQKENKHRLYIDIQ